jgi:hypothetical protein
VSLIFPTGLEIPVNITELHSLRWFTVDCHVRYAVIPL